MIFIAVKAFNWHFNFGVFIFILYSMSEYTVIPPPSAVSVVVIWFGRTHTKKGVAISERPLSWNDCVAIEFLDANVRWMQNSIYTTARQLAGSCQIFFQSIIVTVYYYQISLPLFLSDNVVLVIVCAIPKRSWHSPSTSSSFKAKLHACTALLLHFINCNG